MKETLAARSKLVDKLIGAIIAGDEDTLRLVTTDDCHVQLVTGRDEWRGHGPDALERLARLAGEDPTLTARQAKMHQHPGLNKWVMIASFETPTRLQSRVIVIQFRGDRVASVTYYRLAD